MSGQNTGADKKNGGELCWAGKRVRVDLASTRETPGPKTVEREKLPLCLLGLDPIASLMSKVCIVQLGLSMAEGVPRLVR